MNRTGRRVAALVAVLLAGGAVALGAAAAREPDAGPLAGASFHVQAATAAAQESQRLRAAGRTADADRLAALAARPTAVWFAGEPADPYAGARALVDAARPHGAVPVLVVYAVPGRDCGRFSAGGAPDHAAYYAYVGALAAGIGDARAVVVLEPDAVALAADGCDGARAGSAADPTAQQAAYDRLAAAVDILAAKPGTRVYLDAGHADWVPVDRLADALRRSGVDRAAGFALNVANYRTTEESVAFGQELSGALGGARFVVDTSRNGAGPPSDAESPATGTQSWCNPPGRRVGPDPTGDTGQDRVDAYLWVKDPGASDGTCSPGDPPAGTFWPEHALELAQDLTS